jgi:iron complex outermembrane receptor protein
VPGSTYFQAGQGIDDDYSMKQRSYSLFGQADYKITDKLTVTGGLSYLNDRKRVASDVVLRDPFSALNLQNVPQLTALGLPGNFTAPWAACSSTTATRRPTVRSTSRTPMNPAN